MSQTCHVSGTWCGGHIIFPAWSQSWGAWAQPEEAKCWEGVCSRWVVGSKQWPKAHLDLLVLRRVKGQHLCPKPTGDAKQKLAWSPVLNCSMGTCCSDALLNFQEAVFHWGWNMGENRVFQVTKNEQSNSFTGSWVARRVYLIMGRKPEHSPRYQGRINLINKTKHELEKKY